MLTKKQLLERKNGIGGSDAAAICGLNPYKTAYDVYLEKIGGKEEVLENEPIYWGNRLEDIIAEEYQIRTNKKLMKPENALTHRQLPFMRANVDRVILDDMSVLECKTASSRSKFLWGENGTDEIPTQYLFQCAHYAIVCDAPYVDLAVLIDTSDFRIYRYNRNEALETQIIKKEKRFWDYHVALKIPPEPISLDECNKIYKAITKDKSVMLPSEIRPLLNEVVDFKKQIKKLQEQKDMAELQIKNFMKDAEFITDEYGNILGSWKSFDTNRIDLDFLKKHHPEIYSQCLKQTSVRRFILKDSKND